MDEYFCPNCNAILNDQPGFDPDDGSWTCTECGQTLYGDDIYDGDMYPGTMWYCDGCGALLNKQSGFSDYCSYWTCTECGYSNHISEDEIYDSEEDYQNHINENNDYVDDSDDDNDDDDYSFDPEEGLRRQQAAEQAQRDEEMLRQERIRRQREEYERKQAQKIARKKRVKALFFNKSKIPVGYDSARLVGLNYHQVRQLLTDAGFKRINTIPVKDIYIGSAKAINEVEQVVIAGTTYFEQQDEFSYNAEINITYHEKKEFQIPYTHRFLKKLKYNDAAARLREIGFVNVEEREIPDLVTGWIKKDGSIEEIQVGGNSSFKKNTVYTYDVNICISYHTFKKK